MQRELLGRSTNSTYLYAEHAGHHIHHDDPELVAGTIRSLVEQVRDSTAHSPVIEDTPRSG